LAPAFGDLGLLFETPDRPLGQLIGTGLHFHVLEGRQGGFEQVVKLCGFVVGGQQLLHFGGFVLASHAKRVIE
jgi:hypothetical protein